MAPNSVSWENIETWHKSALFMRGGNSPYVAKLEYIEAIQSQFSQAQIQTVADAGHWLHAEENCASSANHHSIFE